MHIAAGTPPVREAGFGAYTWNELVFDHPAQKEWDRAVFANAELSLERRFGHFQLRWFAGAAAISNPGGGVCVGENVDHCEDDHQGDGNVFPYTGLALGWGWDL